MVRRQTWQDAYDAQMGLWRWYRTPGGHRFLQQSYAMAASAAASAKVADPEGLQMLLAGLYGAEEQKMLTADPVFVSAEMCDVVEAAAEGFKPEPIYSTDFLTHTGFCWYERPFTIADRFDEPLGLRGWSWCRLQTAPKGTDEASLPRLDPLTVDGTVIDMEGDRPEDFTEGLAITLYADCDVKPRTPLGFAPTHVTPWWFGMTFDGNEVDEAGNPTGAAWWWRICQVTLRLMQQRIAVSHTERASRPQRRAAERSGWNDREVQVVRLRRERGEAHEPSGQDANYSHRFVVGGHWRNQWYPSGQVHRQIWISPYVKGPDDKPLVVKPRRAYTWDR